MSINTEMTALANAVRAKTGLTDTLSIAEMTDAISNIELGGDIDLTGVTVTAYTLLDGIVAVDSSGSKVTGNIKTVAASSDGTTVTVPVGYIAKEQSFTIQSGGTGGYDTSAVTATADTMLSGVVAIGKNGETIIGNIETAIPTVSGNIFTVAKGFVAQNTELTVPEATVTETESKVTVSAGYVPENLEIELGAGGETVEYGVITENHMFQKLDLSGDSPVNDGDPVPLGEFGLYKTTESEADMNKPPVTITVTYWEFELEKYFGALNIDLSDGVTVSDGQKPVFSCDNMLEGFNLSEDGILSGCPRIDAGSYTVDVTISASDADSVTTNITFVITDVENNYLTFALTQGASEATVALVDVTDRTDNPNIYNEELHGELSETIAPIEYEYQLTGDGDTWRRSTNGFDFTLTDKCPAARIRFDPASGYFTTWVNCTEEEVSYPDPESPVTTITKLRENATPRKFITSGDGIIVFGKLYYLGNGNEVSPSRPEMGLTRYVDYHGLFAGCSNVVNVDNLSCPLDDVADARRMFEGTSINSSPKHCIPLIGTPAMEMFAGTQVKKVYVRDFYDTYTDPTSGVVASTIVSTLSWLPSSAVGVEGVCYTDNNDLESSISAHGGYGISTIPYEWKIVVVDSDNLGEQ